MAAKTPKKFRQARRAAKVDAKKTFSGAKKAKLKDPLTKYSKDDVEVLKEMKAEAKKGYITDDKGNKISVKPTETAQERMARDRAAAKAEALRMYPYDKAELEAMSKADRQAAELAQKRMSEPKSQKAGKPAPKVTKAGKVRSAVTATEPKPQGYKVDKAGNKIKEKKTSTAKPEYKSVIGKNGKRTKTFGQVSKAVADKTKAPVVKKGFAAGKELNAEGRAIYDKLIKEGTKPKSALNKALFRQEKGAKVAAKAAAPIATAAKSAAEKVKSRVPAGAKPIGVGTMKNGKLTFKFDDKQIKSIVEKNKAAKAIKVPSTVVSSKPNVPGKELAVRPKAGPVVAKTATKKAGAKAAFKTAALGAAKSTGKLFTSKAGLAITAASLLGKPVLQALTKEPAGAKKAKINAAKTPGPEARSNQPRITGQGKFVGVGAGGSTYRVNAGDTLSGIAKKSGVTLSELMAANKKIKDPRKIYRNTAVNIPSKGKVPTGGYAGPVPYRPKKK
jgi:LysM repeat protein